MNTSNNNNNTSGKAPFWKPWGVWGFLWRTLLFLGSILLLCLLFANLRECQPSHHEDEKSKKESGGTNDSINKDNGNENGGNIGFVDPGRFGYGRPLPPPEWDTIIWYEIDTLYGRYIELPPEIRKGEPVDDWGIRIPGVPELPDPGHNYIPPVDPADSTQVIPNPSDSLSKIAADQLIVIFNSKDLEKDMASFAKQFKELYPSSDYKVLYYNVNAGTMLLGVPKSELLKVMEELPKKITDIDFRVTLNEIMEEAFTPSDPGFKTMSYDEYFKLIQAYDAWDITKGDAEVKVAIVDSYFDLTNPEIGERYVDPIHIPSKTKDVLPPKTRPQNEMELEIFCHGTHVAGLAIGAQNNAMGCSGIAPECTWIPVALGDKMNSFIVVEGILYAVNKGADVVNVSLGRSFAPYSNADPRAIHMPIDDQIDYAQKMSKRGEELWEYVYKVANDHKCVLVTAAGNDNFLSGMDPMKRSENVVKVEAVDGRGVKAGFSNFGIVPETDMNYSTVAAPGVSLWSATPKAFVPFWKAIEHQTHMKSSSEGFQEMSGTSMASPVTAGAVALLKSKNKELTADEVISILRMTSKQTDTKNPIGPTIQLKDALDATSGGEKLNFDELMKNHDLLIGKWKSTYELPIYSGDTHEQVDKAWCYMIFDTPDSGHIEWHYIGSGSVPKASLTVQWKKNSLDIIQDGPAMASDGEKLEKYDYSCHPNRSRLLEAVAKGSTVEEVVSFMLEKVN